MHPWNKELGIYATTQRNTSGKVSFFAHMFTSTDTCLFFFGADLAISNVELNVELTFFYFLYFFLRDHN